MPSLGTLLDTALIGPLKTIVGTAVTPLLTTILTSVADPLLQMLGIGIGQMQVTVDGAGVSCALTGYGYSDANHNAARDNGEVGCLVPLYAKLISPSAPGGPAIAFAAIDSNSGAYAFANVTMGNYTVILDDNAMLSDVTPGGPAGWVSTETPTRSRAVSVVTDVSNQNFGLFNGSSLSGLVFVDNGAPSGTANNGLKESGETALAGVVVKAMNSGNSVLYDSALTAGDGSYTVWLPSTVGATAVNIIDVRAAPNVAVSGNVGNTAGAFVRAQDSIGFTNAAGTAYSGVNFGVAPDNSFTNDNQQTILAGTTALYPHTFTAGSTGQLTFSASGTATTPGTWTQVIYRDANCNGVIDSGELPVTVAIPAVANQQICVVVKTQAPADAPINARYTQNVSASFTYTTAAFSAQQLRTDITTIGGSNDADLSLVKSVDKAAAKSGDVLTYTIRYENKSHGPLQNLKIYDTTPTYTVFAAAQCGTLPTGLSNCAISSKPAVGNTGALQWTFAGALPPGGFGTVTFSVTLQ